MKFRVLFLTLMSTLTIGIMSAKDNKKDNSVYVYGFVASFNDSTVYFTDIQELNSAYIQKGGFLYSRDNYAYQLKDYMTKIGVDRPTCVVSFATTRKKIEKKYEALKKRYHNAKYTYIVKNVLLKDYSFKAISIDSTELTKQKISKADKATKKAQSKQKRRQSREQNTKKVGTPQ